MIHIERFLMGIIGTVLFFFGLLAVSAILIHVNLSCLIFGILLCLFLYGVGYILQQSLRE